MHTNTYTRYKTSLEWEQSQPPPSPQSSSRSLGREREFLTSTGNLAGTCVDDFPCPSCFLSTSGDEAHEKTHPQPPLLLAASALYQPSRQLFTGWGGGLVRVYFCLETKCLCVPLLVAYLLLHGSSLWDQRRWGLLTLNFQSVLPAQSQTASIVWWWEETGGSETGSVLSEPLVPFAC